MTGEQAIEFALDELDTDSIRHKEVARESMPFLSIAQGQVELLNGSQIYHGAFIFGEVGGIHGEEAGVVQQSRKFMHLEVEDHGHGRVVVLVEGHDASQRDDDGAHYDREGEVSEHGSSRCLQSVSSEETNNEEVAHT
jgi:hypothetical protein